MADKNEENKKSSKMDTLDKVFMGAVIGGAIGSVLGASIAPKKGKETRQDILVAAKNAGKSSRKIFSKIKSLFSFKKKDREGSGTSDHGHEEHSSIKKIPNEDVIEIEQ